MIFRYLNNQKFDWLLADNGLYFGAAKDQSDISEGEYDHTLITKELQPHIQLPEDYWDHFTAVSHQIQQLNRTSTYLSSWFNGENESQQMWNEYAKDGVAIVSTRDRLMTKLPLPLRQSTEFTEVAYNDELKRKNSQKPFHNKNARFAYESEYRAILNMRNYSLQSGFEKEIFGISLVADKPTYECPDMNPGLTNADYLHTDHAIRKKAAGYVVGYNLSDLLVEIRLHPDATEEFASTVKKRLEQAGLSGIPICHSELTQKNPW